MCRRKNPTPGPTGRRHRFCRCKVRRLGVRGRGSLATRSPVIGTTSRRLRSLRTKEGTASSSSSSSMILTSRRRFGAWLVSAGSTSAGDGSTASDLFLATLSSVVGQGGSVPPHCWCIEDTEQHRPLAGPSLQDSPYQVLATHTPRTGQCLQSAIEPTTSYQLGGNSIHITILVNNNIYLPWELVVPA